MVRTIALVRIVRPSDLHQALPDDAPHPGLEEQEFRGWLQFPVQGLAGWSNIHLAFEAACLVLGAIDDS